MKINVEGLGKPSQYDDRGLVYSQSRGNLYPSKKMFVDFLKQFNDVKAEVDIWAIEDHTKDEVTITLELKHKVKTYKNPPKPINFRCDYCCKTKKYKPIRLYGSDVCRICAKNE